MKKTCYRFLLVLTVLSAAYSGAFAQYNITTGGYTVYPDSMCSDPYFQVRTNAYTSTLSLLTYFGDGTSATNVISNGGTYGFSNFNHTYASAGTFTVKHVLLNGTLRVDSLIASKEYLYCQTFSLKCYNDVNSNCVYDSATESLISLPFTIEVSKAGTPIDTITTLSGFYYTENGASGDIFGYKVLSAPAGVNITCPSSGIVYDTIHFVVNDHVVKYMGASCTGTSGLDLGVYGTVRTGRHSYILEAVVNNAYCTPQTATLTMHCSPKYSTLMSAVPTPTSIVGNTITWNLTGVSLITPAFVSVHFEQSPWLILGDTVHSEFYVTPTTGDANPGNNSAIFIDTVTSSFDPNDKAVKPAGIISSGTMLTYTLRFENTGNDTAFNIHIMDTLSNNVDVKSLNVIASSANVMLGVTKVGTQNIVKFDFPNINLLDSSHHGLCDGMVMFSINTKSGLANGTIIPNRAGIYFDYNDVIMTNQVINVIGIPTSTAVMSNVAPLNIYPNPVGNELTVSTDNRLYNEMNVTNVLGKQLMAQKINAAETTINVKSLPSGIYLLTLKGEGGIQVRKFEKL